MTGAADGIRLRRPALGFDARVWSQRAAIGIADQAMFSGANFLVGIALARWLPVDGFGWFSVLFAIFLLSAGFHNSFVVEPLCVLGPSRFRERLRSYGNRVVALHFAVCAVLATILAAGALLFTTAPWRSAAVTAAAAVPFMLLIWLIRRYFHTALKPARALVASALYMAAVLGGLALVRQADGLSVSSAFVILAAGGLLAGGTYWVGRGPLRDEEPAAATPRLGEIAGTHIRYGRWQAAADLVSAIGIHGPVFWTAAQLGLEATAALRAATNFMLPMAQVVTAISTLLLPVVAQDFAARRFAAARRKTRLAVLVLVGVSGVYVVLLLAFRAPIEAIVYGGKYAGYTWLIPVLGLIPLLSAASVGCSLRLRAAQLPRHYLLTALATTTVSLVSAAVLITAWDLPGAAATSVLAYVAGAAALYAMDRRWLRGRPVAAADRPPPNSAPQAPG